MLTARENMGRAALFLDLQKMTVFTRNLFQETDHLDLREFVIELSQPDEQFQAVPPMEAFHNCNKEAAYYEI